MEDASNHNAHLYVQFRAVRVDGVVQNGGSVVVVNTATETQDEGQGSEDGLHHHELHGHQLTLEQPCSGDAGWSVSSVAAGEGRGQMHCRSSGSLGYRFTQSSTLFHHMQSQLQS